MISSFAYTYREINHHRQMIGKRFSDEIAQAIVEGRVKDSSEWIDKFIQNRSSWGI